MNKEPEPTIEECLANAEHFADKVLEEGIDPAAINVADSVKWICEAVRLLAKSPTLAQTPAP